MRLLGEELCFFICHIEQKRHCKQNQKKMHNKWQPRFFSLVHAPVRQHVGSKYITDQHGDSKAEGAMKAQKPDLLRRRAQPHAAIDLTEMDQIPHAGTRDVHQPQYNNYCAL